MGYSLEIDRLGFFMITDWNGFAIIVIIEILLLGR